MSDGRTTDPDEAPLYHRLFAQLRGEILAGSYDGARVLPSEKQLEERFNVSRITVRRAVEELERAGLVERARGRATRLADRRSPIFADVDDELANMLATVSELETRLHHFRWISPDKELAARLETGRGEKVLWIVRSRARAGQVVMHSTLYLPSRIGEGFQRQDLAGGAIVDLLRRRGIHLASGEQTMSARPAPQDVSERMDIPTGAPVFFLRRLIRDDEGLPVLFNDVMFRWDAFTYSMVLAPAGLRPHDPENGSREPHAGLQLLQE